MRFCEASASVTAGLKCAPKDRGKCEDSGYKRRTRRHCIREEAGCKFPPQSRSAMIPKPTTAIWKKCRADELGYNECKG